MHALTERQQRRRRNNRAFKRERKRIGAIKGNKPARDKDYLGWIAALPCLICWLVEWLAIWRGEMYLSDLTLRDVFVPRQTTNSEAAHTGPHGMSVKAPDSDAIPLCRHHHQEAKDAQGKSRNWFAEHDLDRDAVLTDLRAQYEAERE